MDTKIGFGMVNAIELIKSFLVDEGRWMMVCDRTSCSKHCRVRRERLQGAIELFTAMHHKIPVGAGFTNHLRLKLTIS
ncbi:hypothetical protein QT970_12260 [Microcoleus sp. herbarium8]|uniref:hypothetical protein n=1 Tax=Microcoleus sp. herbarium8 TaxID=3055436 RepID=UPI002FD52C27